MSKLVIVESPAKAKTIAKYLGSDYEVKASMGHLRDLPEKKIGVDVKKNFEPAYTAIAGKDEIIKNLRSRAAVSEKVYLATDPDREGEAISWHLKELLELNDTEPNRVTFNEITKNAVNEGIANPRHINMQLVDAQQARRVLDRLVGYKLSPFLWKKVKRGLSAGRVQSVVTRLVVEREREIRKFNPEEYWTLELMLAKKNAKHTFAAKYHGTSDGKVDLHTESETTAVLNDVQAYADANGGVTIKSIKRTDRRRNPSAPFITSTLQQEAARRLGMQSKRTMAVAQQLYEGVELSGRGLTGLITYMRTDSTRLSEEATSAARAYIVETYGKEYCPKSVRVFKTKNAAQDAHEAIRPSDVRLTPELLKNDLNRDQLRLYKLIWERFVACQMATATLDVVGIEIEAGTHLFKASGQTVKFPGFMALYEEKKEDSDEDEFVALPVLEEGELLRLDKIVPAQHFTQPPARYNEASLIKAMEEKGIGRPSTYAPTISTILDRDYVEKEGKALKPTPLGEAVTDLMIDKFSDIVDVKFTAGMETDLDKVEAGSLAWKELIAKFYGGFHTELKKAEEEMKEQRVKIREEESDEICELCGRKMVIKYGRFGKFLACPGYPECKNTKAIADDTGFKCPKCGGRILRKKSKSGKVYYGCEFNPKCDFMTWDAPIADLCPKCGHNLFRHNFRGEKSVSCLQEGCDYLVIESMPKAKKEKKEDTAGKSADEKKD